MEILNLPAQIYSGDSVTFTDSLADYPASDGWTLNYVLSNADEKQTIASAPSGDDHDSAITAAASSKWNAGAYKWVCYALNAPQRITIGAGSVSILPDPMAGASDRRHHVERVIDAIEAVLEKKATSDDFKVDINGRALQRYLPEELIVWRNKYKAELRQIISAERMAQGLGSGNRVEIRFT